MMSGRAASKAARHVCLQCRAQVHNNIINTQLARGGARRGYSSHDAFKRSDIGKSRAWTRVFLLGALGPGAVLFCGQVIMNEAPNTEDGEPVIEQRKKRRDDSKEANRDAISSQHVQVKQSWENPGVFVWGSNSGKVVDQGSKENTVKNPRRIAFFDGQALRDLKLDRSFGAAINDRGDLYLWGAGYSDESVEPEKVLSGKNLRSLAISQDRVFALSSKGQVYSLPVSKADQLAGEKPYESSWIPFWPSRSRISYKVVDVPDKAWGEKITQVASGVEHGLLLTSNGRLFSFASSSSAYPSRGQLGVPGILSWETRPAGPYDRPHLVATLQGFNIETIATGDYHSLVSDSASRVFGFGDNSSGQLGIPVSSDVPYIDAPSLLNLSRLYAGTAQSAKVTGVAAGGAVSMLTIDATRVASVNDNLDKPGTRAQLGKVTADVWAFGQGIYGTLGNGRWTHVQDEPARIRALSGLFEYDEKAKTIIPIRLSKISIGSTHAGAIMDNVTHLGATDRTGENDVNWGADVLWWGGNEHYQLGTGRRANVNNPTYIGPLEDVGDGTRREEHRLHITPPKKIKVNGRNVTVEQSIECGRMVSAVYSRIID